MNTWAILAAEHVTHTSGITLTTVPGLGSAALNGFAAGVLAGGACLALVQGSRRLAGGALISGPAVQKKAWPRRPRPVTAGHRAAGGRSRNAAHAVSVAMRPATELGPLPLPVAGRNEATRPYSDLVSVGPVMPGRSIWLPAAAAKPAAAAATPTIAVGYLPAEPGCDPVGSLDEPDFDGGDVIAIGGQPFDPSRFGRSPAGAGSPGRRLGRRLGRRGRRGGLGNMLSEMLSDEPEDAPPLRQEDPDEIFWGPGEGRDERSAGGYHSKHRLRDAGREPKLSDGERWTPRHAAPPQASASMRLGSRNMPRSVRYAPRTAG